MRPRIVCCRTVVVCLLAGSVSVGKAQSWKAPADGSWGVAENWSGGAVPGGAAPVAFTNGHEGTVTVTLDGDRTQTGGMTFGGGDWLFAPGTPAASMLTLGGSLTTVDGVTTLGVAGTTAGGGTLAKLGPGELRIAGHRQFLNTPVVVNGVLRVAPEGRLQTGASTDIFVEGTGTLTVDGGRVDTKIVRMGQEVFPTNALFRMTSGTVNCGGSGDAVLLVGYNMIDGRWGGEAVVEILGGMFSATGAVSDAGVFIGPRHHGTLKVGGSETSAVLDCARVWFGWKDAASQQPTTNLLIVATNGTVSASVAVFVNHDPYTATVRLQEGGLLRTPTVYSRTRGTLDVVFEGGRLELIGSSNTLFTGVNTRVAVAADSALDIGANPVACPAPFSGGGTLTKRGTGTLSLTGDHAAFTGAWSVAEGALALGGGTALPEAAALLLADGTALDVSALHALRAHVVAVGDAAVIPHSEGATFHAVTLGNGTVALAESGPVAILSLEIPDGATADLSSAGHVSIGALSGGGALTVSGGGTFDVIDDALLTGTVEAAPDGTVLNLDQTSVESLHLFSDTEFDTFGKTITVGALTLSGGTLSATGGGELVVQNLTVDGAAALAAGSGALTNIASLTFAPGAELTVETAATVYFGVAQGTGTLRLGGGAAEIASLGSGVSFDILDGEVRAVPVPSSATPPPFASGEPAFWVDASAAASLATVGGKLEWSDCRGGAYTMKAVSTNVTPTVVSEPSLGGMNAVKFASPHNYGQWKGMAWNQRLENVRTVFWIIGAQEGGGQLLGDTSHIDFLRGEVPPGRPGAGSQLDWPKGIHYAPLISQAYANSNRDHIPCVANGLFRIDGTAVNPLQTGFPNPGYHVVSLRATNNVCAAAFATERTTQSSDRSGCQRLAECLVFTNALTDAEIEAAEAYLQRKWFGTGVRARSVRLGGADARFTVRNGGVLVDELRVDVDGLHPTNAVAGVARVERLVAPYDLELDYDAATQSLSLNVHSLRVADGADVTVNAPSYAAVWLGEIAGHGNIAVAGGVSLDVGSAATLDGEQLTLAVGASAPVTVRSWLGRGRLEIAGASAVNLPQADISGNAHLAVTGGTDIPLDMSIVRATGAWTLSGSVDPLVNTVFLYGDGQALTLDTGGHDLRVNVFNGRGTLAWNGPDKIRILTSLRSSDGNNPVLPTEAFVPDIPQIILGANSRSIGFTGGAALTVNQFIVEGEPNTPCYLNFAPGVSMTVANFQHRPSNSALLYLPQEGTLTIDALLMRSQCAVYFPSNRVTAVRTLATTPADGRVIVRGGTLQVTETVNTCRNFTVIGDGIIFPGGTTLTPSVWDVRTPARFGLGEGSTFTFDIANQTNAYAVTFAGGALAVAADTVFLDALRLEGTALSVAPGKTLTAASLTGHDTVALGAGATLAVAELHGFDGTVVNNGGTLAVSNARTNTIPAGPVVAPTFWVDASQSGSFQTNASGKLVWFDKRTARDGASGLMFATALSNSLPPILQNQLNGLPVVDFGPLGTGPKDERGMIWNQRITTVRAVHWVIGAQNGGGQLLGDMASGGDIDWFRYSDNTTQPTPNYRYGNGGDDYRTPILPSPGRWGDRAGRMGYIHNGTAYLNGVQNDGLGISNGFPTADYHLVSVRTTGPTYAAAFASERVGHSSGYGNRSGAQRLGEVLVYGVPLTAEQNRDNDAYLSWKWFARRLDGYRTAGEDLIALRGSGAVSGSVVLAREIAPAPAGLSVDGALHLDAYPSAAETGAVIRLETLPMPGTAAVSVGGDAFLPSRVTVVLGEVRAGVFTVLGADGTLRGSPEWRLDTSAVPNAGAYQIKLVQRDDAVVLTITAKGTMMFLE